MDFCLVVVCCLLGFLIGWLGFVCVVGLVFCLFACFPNKLSATVQQTNLNQAFVLVQRSKLAQI